MSNLVFVQANGAEASTSVSVAYSSATTGSSLLLCFIQLNQTFTLSSITDTLGNTWVLQKFATYGNGKKNYIYAVPINKAAGGANTVTVSVSAGAGLNVVGVMEYTGQNTTTPIDGISGIKDSITIAYAGLPFTPRYTNEVIIGLGIYSSAFGVFSTGSGWTGRFNGTGNTYISTANFGAEDQSSNLGVSVVPTALAADSGQGFNAEFAWFTVGLLSTSSVPLPPSAAWLEKHRDFVNKR